VPETATVRQFLLLAFALLLPCFGLWTVGSGLLALPPAGFASMVLTNWFPTLVDTVYADGQHALLMTRFGEQDGRPVPLAGAEYQFGFQLDTLLLTYSIPFYTALHFATPRASYFNAWVIGLIVLLPLSGVGLVCMGLKELMVGLGNTFLQQPDAWVPNPNLIGLLYQVSVLLVPTLAPVVLWLVQNRNSVLLRGLLRAEPMARAG
jgi:hypothetical protein